MSEQVNDSVAVDGVASGGDGAPETVAAPETPETPATTEARESQPRYAVGVNPTHGCCITEPHISGRGVHIIATVRDEVAARRLVGLALAGAGGGEGADASGIHVLTEVEYGAMRRDVEKFRQLEDDIAAGRKIVTDVPAPEQDAEHGPSANRRNKKH